MTEFTVGIIGMIFLVLMFTTGLPIAFAMILVGLAGFSFMVSPVAAFHLLSQDVFELFGNYMMSVIPMYVFMGCFAFAAGIGRKLFEVARVALGQMNGGLTIASVAACTGFGAVCGSSTATCATIGKIALPEMRRYGYSDRLATGTIAVSGGLGVLIPPSITFVVYGILTEQSIGKLFLAGILPGLLIASLFIITIWVLCKLDSNLGPPGPSTTWRQKIASLLGIFDPLFLFIVTMVGLFAGWFGPSQAGAIGCVTALIIGLARREVTWRKFVDAAKDGMEVSCMILLLMAGATIFGHFMAVTTMPLKLLSFTESYDLPPVVFITILSIVWFILGCFIDAMPILLLLLPLIYPVIKTYGYDPIWFGVFVTVLSIIALVTPPVGLNAYVTQAVAKDVPLETVFKGIIPFLIPLAVACILLVAFPQIATLLPNILIP